MSEAKEEKLNVKKKKKKPRVRSSAKAILLRDGNLLAQRCDFGDGIVCYLLPAGDRNSASRFTMRFGARSSRKRARRSRSVRLSGFGIISDGTMSSPKRIRIHIRFPIIFSANWYPVRMRRARQIPIRFRLDWIGSR